jgi:MFS family permease
MSQLSSSTPSIDEEKGLTLQPDNERPSIHEKPLEPFQAPPAPEAVSPYHPSQFPDGGKHAYLCLLGGALCLFCSFGWLNALGVFQNYYQMNQLRNYSPSTIAWIPSLQIFMMFLPGPIVGWFYDNHGPKYLIVVGTLFHVIGLMMTSLCTEYYQFILAQGICSPLGLNCIFQASTNSIPTWFLKKRGLSYGIMAAGSGLGGIIFPIMASHLIPEIGFAWTMRTIAFLILGLMIIAFLTVKSRLPPKPRALQLQVFLEPFKDVKFVLITASSFFFFMGIFIPINFIEVIAIHDGMSIRLAGYLLAVLNAAR